MVYCFRGDFGLKINKLALLVFQRAAFVGWSDFSGPAF